MRKPEESAANRIWRDKLQSCASLREGVVIFIFALGIVLVGVLLAAGS